LGDDQLVERGRPHADLGRELHPCVGTDQRALVAEDAPPEVGDHARKKALNGSMWTRTISTGKDHGH
jgi:hypothetical protein